MPRNPGPANLQGRLRAFEMFAAGMRKAEIARELGVTRACINDWRKKDLWAERLDSTVKNAQEAVDHALGNEIAEVIATLRGRLKLRIAQLEKLCDSPKDETKLRAIQAWLQLAGIKQGIPSPVEPARGSRNLHLIQDLLPGEKHVAIEEDDGEASSLVEGVSG